MFVSGASGLVRESLRRRSPAALFFALALTAVPASGADNAAFVSYSGVPMTMKPGEKATVTVTMRNTGTTTWRTTNVRSTSQGSVTTTRTSYALRPVGGNVWGVTSVAVTGGVAPNATRGFRFTITAPTAPGNYAFQWKMDRLTIIVERPTIPARSDWGFGAATTKKMIAVAEPAADTRPSFNGATIPDQRWLVGSAITSVTLPEAAGGNGALKYTFSGCRLPGGVRRSGRLIHGTPTAESPPRTCTWKVTDSDANTAESDTDKVTLKFLVERPGLVVDKARLEVEEEKSGTFDVKLGAKPTGNVTVKVTSGDTTAATVNKASLTFTTSNYLTAQTVTVTGVNDPDAHDETTSIGLRASGGGYDGVSGAVAVKLIDDDPYGDPIVEPESLEIGENKSGSFRVKLPTQPTGDDVTVTVTSADPGAVSVKTKRLTFNSVNYATWKTVTVAGVRDADAWNESEKDVTVKANGGGYDGQSASVHVAVEDDDEPGVLVSPAPPASLQVDEGGNKPFSVQLATLPSKPVTVTVSVPSGDSEAMSVNPAKLSFNGNNYNSWQTVWVSGDEDPDATNEQGTIDLLASGGDYAGESASVNVAVADDDERGLVVSKEELAVDEGAADAFTVKLATKPTATVTVAVKSGDADEATVDTASLTFTTTNYGVARTVTVSGKQDDDASDETASISLAASGGDYAGESGSVTVKVDDDDEPALVLSESSLSVAEGGSGTYTVALATEPSGAVTVSISGMSNGVSVDDSSLTFSTSDWNQAQPVTVSAAEDENGASEEVTLTNTASGADYGFAAAAAVTVTTTDNDDPGLVVAPASLEIEEGDSGQFTVKLATAPTSTVVVSVESGDAGAATVNPASLTFTTANYGEAQTVTVTGEQDDDSSDETVNVGLSASGGDYGAVSGSVSVAVDDDDNQGLVVIPESLEIAEGGSAAYTVALAAEPSGTVTVSITGMADGVSVDDASLTFSTSNWNQAQTVTVSAAEDDNGVSEEVTLTNTPSGGDYGAAHAKTVAVTTTDNDKPALLVSPASLEIDEGDAGRFTVALATAPTATVTVSLTSGDTTAATVDPPSLSFAAADYGTPREVTVSGVEDDDADNESTSVSLAASGGDYAGVSASVSVEVAEVEAPSSDDASFVTYVDVPSSMTAGGKATVTVRMRNTGTTTWSSTDGYALGSQRPDDNARWGLSRVALASEVAPRGTADFTFEITAPDKAGGPPFRWRMVRGDGVWFGRKTKLWKIRVEEDTSPSFGESTIPRQTWAKKEEISLTLPSAAGGNGEVSYALSGDLPAGVTFKPSTRTLSGAPSKKQKATEYTYTATDADGDEASLKFSIEVTGKASDDASFVSYTGAPSRMAAGGTATVTVRMRNTGGTTWTKSAGYGLGSQRPDDNARWGASRIGLPSEVPPGATVDFTFEITAPEKVRDYRFQWRMIRGTDGWFGDKSELAEITVEDPSFGDASVSDLTWVMGQPIESLTLPEASGGDGALTYALTPSPPAGVSFTEAIRALSGTPTKDQAATEYKYTATDIDGDVATLVFSITVEESSGDDASFVSMSGVPSKIVAGVTATVTVTMRNTGTTTWTPFRGYGLGSESPRDNETWGVRRAPLSASVAPNEDVTFTFPITAPETTGSYTFAWRMVRDPGMWFGTATGDVTVTVEDPSFGDTTISDQTWKQDETLESLTLPAASGGDGGLTYALTPDPPAGVNFNPATRVLSGTPTTAQDATEYTYTATDADGDAATLMFSITVEAAPVDDASFVSMSGLPSRMVAGGTATVTVTMKNTGTTTWSPFRGYGLGSESPRDNETWGGRRAPLSGSVAPNEEATFTLPITAPETTGSYTFAWRMVRDPGMWFGTVTGNVMVTVEDPSFGAASISDQTWVKDESIQALTLPAASGGDGELTYALTPELPAGVTFDAKSRSLSGAPTVTKKATAYAYTATDEDGDRATLAFTITVSEPLSAAQSSAAVAGGVGAGEAEMAVSPGAGVFDMFDYWLLPHGSAMPVRARYGDGRLASAGGSGLVRSFWRGELWGRKLALLGDPGGERYDIFEDVEDGLYYWGTFEGAAGATGRQSPVAAGVVEDRQSWSLDRPFRWMDRFMAVGEVLEDRVTGRMLSDLMRTQEAVVEATMRLEVLSHHASFTIPVEGGLTFEDVLAVRFWPDAARPEAHDTFHLAGGLGAVYWRRSAAAPAGAIEWWAVEKALAPVVPSSPTVPWFDPFSPGWPKTAVLNGNLEDAGSASERERLGNLPVPGWTADSGDAALGRTPQGLAGGSWSLLLRGSAAGGDSAPDAVTTGAWIPVEGGTYRLSACLLRESAADNVVVDFDDGKGRDADFADAHLVAASTGVWECRAVTKCIPASVGAVRIRAARDGANAGDAWFDRVELKRVAACTMPPGALQP